jgi:excisionase family DNA binding protein
VQRNGTHGTDQQDPFVSVRETAGLLKVSPPLVYRRFHAGEIPGRRIGRKIDIYRSFIDALLAEFASGRNVDVGVYAAEWKARNAAEAAVA